MKKPVLMCALILVWAFSARITASEYYPVDKGYSWTYEGYMKNDPQKPISVTAVIPSIEKNDGKKYFFYNAPSVDVRYFVRCDESWAYMRVIKYPFPVLNFLTVDVYLTPEVKFAKFPYRIGDTWDQIISAEAALIPFSMHMDIKCKFTVMESEKFTFDGKIYDIFRIRMERDEGNNHIRIEDNWFAEGLGFVRGNTPDYYIELKKFTTPAEKAK